MSWNDQMCLDDNSQLLRSLSEQSVRMEESGGMHRWLKQGWMLAIIAHNNHICYCNSDLVYDSEFCGFVAKFLIVLFSDPQLQMFLYGLIGLIMFLIVAVLVLWQFIHAQHKKRMSMLSLKEQMLSHGSDKVHIAQISDVTLQVCHCHLSQIQSIPISLICNMCPWINVSVNNLTTNS